MNELGVGTAVAKHEPVEVAAASPTVGDEVQVEDLDSIDSPAVAAEHRIAQAQTQEHLLNIETRTHTRSSRLSTLVYEALLVSTFRSLNAKMPRSSIYGKALQDSSSRRTEILNGRVRMSEALVIAGWDKRGEAFRAYVDALRLLDTSHLGETTSAKWLGNESQALVTTSSPRFRYAGLFHREDLLHWITLADSISRE